MSCRRHAFSSRRSASPGSRPCSSTILSREVWPETTETDARGTSEALREQPHDGVVRTPALGRCADAHLPARRRAGRRAPCARRRARPSAGDVSSARPSRPSIGPGFQAAFVCALLLRLDGLRLLDPVVVGLVEGVERGVQQEPQPAGLDRERLALAAGLAGDRAGLGLGLGEDRVGLPLGLVFQLVRGPLGRDERRAQQRLELAVALELAFEQLDAVGLVGPLAPDGLEARRDLVEQACRPGARR